MECKRMSVLSLSSLLSDAVTHFSIELYAAAVPSACPEKSRGTPTQGANTVEAVDAALRTDEKSETSDATEDAASPLGRITRSSTGTAASNAASTDEHNIRMSFIRPRVDMFPQRRHANLMRYRRGRARAAAHITCIACHSDLVIVQRVPLGEIVKFVMAKYLVTPCLHTLEGMHLDPFLRMSRERRTKRGHLPTKSQYEIHRGTGCILPAS